MKALNTNKKALIIICIFILILFVLVIIQYSSSAIKYDENDNINLHSNEIMQMHYKNDYNGKLYTFSFRADKELQIKVYEDGLIGNIFPKTETIALSSESFLDLKYIVDNLGELDNDLSCPVSDAPVVTVYQRDREPYYFQYGYANNAKYDFLARYLFVFLPNDYNILTPEEEKSVSDQWQKMNEAAFPDRHMYPDRV